MNSGDKLQRAAAVPHDSTEAAFEYACRLLKYRDRSTAELTRRLRMRGFSDEAVRNALQRLVNQNLVNDERFARAYCAMQLRRGRSPRLIAALLRREHAIGEPPPEPDEDPDAAILAILRRRFKGCDDSPAVRRRIVGFLVRRGFTASDIRRLTASLHLRVPPSDDGE